MNNNEPRKSPMMTAIQAVTVIKKRAGKLTERSSAPFTDLANELCDLRGIDQSRFREHVSDLGLSPRKAYYLIKIWDRLEGVVPSERLEKLGWSKLKVLLPNINERNAEAVLVFAEKHTVRECELYLSKQPYREKTRCMLIRFSVKDYAIFADAIVRHGGQKRGKGLAGTEKALLKIIAKAKNAERHKKPRSR
jgi:hypothetical protein